MKVTLKDGSIKEYTQPMSIVDIAKDISEGLARVACAGEINGEVKDLRTVIEEDWQFLLLRTRAEELLTGIRRLMYWQRRSSVSTRMPSWRSVRR